MGLPGNRSGLGLFVNMSKEQDECSLRCWAGLKGGTGGPGGAVVQR